MSVLSESLYTTKSNEVLTIVSVPSIALLECMGLRVGTQIKIKHKYAFGGPVLLKVEDSFLVAVGKDIAKQVVVSLPC